MVEDLLISLKKTMAKPEKVEEGKFVAKVRAHNYICIKLSSQGGYGEDGFNDELVLANYGVTALFEFKKEDVDKVEKLQNYRHKHLKRLGHKTYVVRLCSEAYKILMGLVKAAAARSAHKTKVSN